MASGALLPFDAAYCAFRVRPAGTRLDTAAPKRHPEAFFAILSTDVKCFSGQGVFGGVTKGPRDRSSPRNSPIPLHALFKQRTALGSRRLKALPASTDAPKELSTIPQLPSNDYVALRANFPKAHAAASDPTRHSATICASISRGLLGPHRTVATATRQASTLSTVLNATSTSSSCKPRRTSPITSSASSTL